MARAKQILQLKAFVAYDVLDASSPREMTPSKTQNKTRAHTFAKHLGDLTSGPSAVG